MAAGPGKTSNTRIHGRVALAFFTYFVIIVIVNGRRKPMDNIWTAISSIASAVSAVAAVIAIIQNRKR